MGGGGASRIAVSSIRGASMVEPGSVHAVARGDAVLLHPTYDLVRSYAAVVVDVQVDAAAPDTPLVDVCWLYRWEDLPALLAGGGGGGDGRGGGSGGGGGGGGSGGGGARGARDDELFWTDRVDRRQPTAANVGQATLIAPATYRAAAAAAGLPAAAAAAAGRRGSTAPPRGGQGGGGGGGGGGGSDNRGGGGPGRLAGRDGPPPGSPRPPRPPPAL